MKWILAAFVLVLCIAVAGRSFARTRVIEAGPDPLSEIVLLGAAIEQANGRPVHIVYVHGMRAEGPDASAELRAALVRFGFRSEGSHPSVRRQAAETWPENATYAGRKIWTRKSWAASQPFRNRHVLVRGLDKVVIDEINWWPLLFPLKCQALLRHEGPFSGLDRKHLRLCAETAEPYHPWLSKKQLDKALATRPLGGRGAWPNAMVKRQIFNWGLADAVIALGTMRKPIREAIEWAFADLSKDEELRNSRRVIVAESLGSFVVLDALYRDTPATTQFVEETADLYFFANQFALLELARIDGVPSDPSSPRAAVQTEPELGGPSSALLKLAQAPVRDPGRLGAAPHPRQIVAFSDPSDMLTWPVPCLPEIKVANVMVPMTGGAFGLFANPIRAHRGHLEDRSVWDVMMNRKPARRPKSHAPAFCPERE